MSHLTPEFDELRISLDRLRAMLESFVVRGLRACGPEQLVQLKAYTEQFEQAGAGHVASVLAELHARYQGGLMRAVASRASGQAAVPASECRELADELRAWLREIGDAATREARRLQAELDAIGEEIAEAADAATPAPTATGTDPRPRRHRVKP